MSSTWAVVVIHGVGATNPGDTLDALVPEYLKRAREKACEEGRKIEICLEEPPEVHLLEEPPEVRRLLPPPENEKRFPMHRRKYKITPPKDEGPDRAVFAEVYWADLSVAGRGLWQLLLRLFTVIFGITFLADEASTIVGLFWSRFLRPILYFASSILCGPIAALNVFLLYMLLAHFGIMKVIEALNDMNRVRYLSSVGIGLAVGIIVLFVWVLWLKRRRVQADTIYLLTGFVWTVTFGLIAFIVARLLFTSVDWPMSASLVDKAAVFRLSMFFFCLGLVLLVVGLVLLIGGLVYRLWAQREKKTVPWLNQWLLGFTTLIAAASGLSLSHLIVLQPPAFVCSGGAVLGLVLTLVGFFVWAVALEKNRVDWQLRGSDGATVGAGLTICFGILLMVQGKPTDDLLLLPDVGMIGYGLAGGLLSLALWRWGVRSGWSGTWVLLHFFDAVAGLTVATLAVYRIWIFPELYKDSFLGKMILARLPVPSNGVDAFEAQISGLVFSARCGLVVVTILVVLAFLAGVAGWAECDPRNNPKFKRMERALEAALGATLLQIGVWIILAPAFCLIALKRLAPERVAKEDHLFDPVWNALALHLALAAIVGLFALGVFAYRLWWVVRNPPHYTGEKGPHYPVEESQKLRRILFNLWILYPLIICSLFGSITFSCSFCSGGTGVPPFLQSLLSDGTSTTIVAIFVGVLTVAYALFRKGLRDGLHIVNDIVSHFHRLRQPDPLESPREEIQAEDYITEMRMEARVRRVLEEVLRDPSVTHLSIVAHSQGTVLAIHTLCRAWPVLQSECLKQNVRLVTLGSPFTHLYQFYFPRRYPPLFDSAGQVLERWKYLRENISKWINIYRVDDYIGVEIKGDSQNTFPENRAIPAGGHTNYWKADEALRLILHYLPR